MITVARVALVAAAVVLFAGAGLGTGVIGAGAPQYPDLRTLPPKQLFFDTLPDGTRVLRFSNTVWNAGPGRLEMEGDPSPQQGKPIYQNTYDKRGNPVGREQVNSDFVYHPTHQHFHFADFATYRLLRQDRRGEYRQAAKQQEFGEKTGFCIMDSRPVASPAPATYFACDQAAQGLSVGWGDVYDYTLDDQWVALRGGLKDGEYALESTADPRNRLDEGGRDDNNAATAYFTVRGGQVADVRGKP